MLTKHHDAQDEAEVWLRCPTDLVKHIAEIEAGWTLPKWWKAHDEDRTQAENQREVRDMLARWREHGIIVTAGAA